jgi:RNA 3'-terminal phosphate cyclase (ATP)
MIEIDGSRYSGSGTIVRQAVTLSALTGEPIHVTNARASRVKPGLQPQHMRVITSICELVNGRSEGVCRGSLEFKFWPGKVEPGAGPYLWDIGSAGSTTLLALSVIPVMAFAPDPMEAELRGGIFQDFAPSWFHLQHVMLPLLARMGLQAEIEMRRPGYVPKGAGVLRLTMMPLERCLRPLIHEEPGVLENFSGVALASHLKDRAVARRMAEASREVFKANGYDAKVDIEEDTDAIQPGAALAIFANLAGGGRLGADWAGAPGRPAEAIGKHVAMQLLKDLKSGATLDRFAADQIVPFAALAEGESRFRIPEWSDHVQSNAWLVREFLGAQAEVTGQILSVRGVGFRAVSWAL